MESHRSSRRRATTSCCARSTTIASPTGVGKIEKQLARAVEKGKLEQGDADAARGRIAPTTDYADFAGCDLVIEAITEDLGLKLEMWRELDGIVKPDAYFATNTSSLAVVDQAAATSRPERFLGLHFFNPAQVMALVEVIRAVTTSDEAFQAGLEFGGQASARSRCRRATRPASSSTACSCPTCSTRSAPTRRASARSRRSTTR